MCCNPLSRNTFKMAISCWIRCRAASVSAAWPVQTLPASAWGNCNPLSLFSQICAFQPIFQYVLCVTRCVSPVWFFFFGIVGPGNNLGSKKPTSVILSDAGTICEVGMTHSCSALQNELFGMIFFLHVTFGCSSVLYQGTYIYGSICRMSSRLLWQLMET